MNKQHLVQLINGRYYIRHFEWQQWWQYSYATDRRAKEVADNLDSQNDDRPVNMHVNYRKDIDRVLEASDPYIG